MKTRLPSKSRRMFTRVNAHRLTVSFSPPPPPSHEEKDFKVRDLGVYGMSFIVPDDHTSDFRLGVILKEMSFELAGRKIILNAQVRYVRELKAKSRITRQIGVEFIDIAPDDIFFISQYVVKRSITQPEQIRIPLKRRRTK